MKTWGFGFAALAVMLAIWWAVFDPTADAGLDPTTYQALRVANLQRLHFQSALLQAALASGLAAVVCFVGSGLLERLGGASGHSSAGDDAIELRASRAKEPWIATEKEKQQFWWFAALITGIGVLVYLGSLAA